MSVWATPFRCRWSIAAIALAAAACAQVAVDSETAPSALVPQLFAASEVYKGIGLLAAGDPLPFVAGVRYLGGPSGDSTLGVLGVSLANRALSFRRSGDVYEARYRVEVTFRLGGHIVTQVAQEETVRVVSFPETQRSDESLIFQRFVMLPPGPLDVTISIRDGFGSGFNRVTGSIQVPRYRTEPALSSLVPIYEGTPRGDRSALPDIVVNPRATVPYGADSLLVYFEEYGVGPRDVVVRLLAGQDQRELWRDTVPGSAAPFSGRVLRLSPAQLPVGEILLQAFIVGGVDTVSGPALISFSDQWVVANFDETLFLLRYFGYDDAVRTMREASAAQRLDLWRRFWKDTDPDPATAENEALELYFQRLQEANERFREGTDPGWLTDRGEVYITLGEPDELFDSSSDLQGQGQRYIRWSYISLRVTIDFVDETGFGRFRLTTASRAAYQEALIRKRRGN
jgi:GWxTD domain-containing protein